LQADVLLGGKGAAMIRYTCHACGAKMQSHYCCAGGTEICPKCKAVNHVPADPSDDARQSPVHASRTPKHEGIVASLLHRARRKFSH
jgi:uncharacterized Zn finger protein (UPF0148 family)